MNRVCRVVIGLLLVAAVWPEPRRYLAERRLAAARSIVVSVSAHPSDDPRRKAYLELAQKAALEAAAAIPGDSRGLLTAGSAHLLSKEPATALELYRAAFDQGERAEIDLDLGRAYAMLDQRPAALAAFVRTVWISPELLTELPRAAKPLASTEVVRLESLLKSGGLKEAPAIQLP